jgi:hypothetical protein
MRTMCATLGIDYDQLGPVLEKLKTVDFKTEVERLQVTIEKLPAALVNVAERMAAVEKSNQEILEHLKGRPHAPQLALVHNANNPDEPGPRGGGGDATRTGTGGDG